MPSIDMCSTDNTNPQISVTSSILLNSPNFPKYPTQDVKCLREVVAPAGMAMKVYVLTALFKGAEKK